MKEGEEEGPCTSYSQRKEDMKHELHLESKILSEYLAEYKAKSRASKETLALPQFIQLEEERRPHSYGMMRGNRFLLSTFDGSLTCAAKAWVMKLEAVEIAVLHLEGEANTWWFSHLSHARVTTLAEFSQRLIRKFGKGKEKPSPPLEEACTSAVTTLEEQPSCSAVKEDNIFEKGALAYTSHQGMPEFPSLFISANHMKGSTSLHVFDLEQHNCTAL